MPIGSTPVEADDSIYISGWGVTHPQSKIFNPSLRAVWVKVYSYDDCVRSHGYGAISESMFCAGES